jgi:mevalonate kinase
LSCSASAPGKIILFGEHAVVYGRPALAVPLTQVHADVEVSGSSRRGVWIEASDIGLHAELSTLPPDHPLAAVIRNLSVFLGAEPFPNLTICISSTIPVASGLGSGAAVSVALLRALSAYLGKPLKDDDVNRLAFEIEALYHGSPSGIDNTVIVHERPVYFIKGEPLQMLRVAMPFTIIVGDTGISAPTRESVGALRKLWELDKEHWQSIFEQVGRIVDQARAAMEGGKPDRLGDLMDQNHSLLQEMTVSSPELDALVQAARRFGALGAKMSGGGRGGNMIALVKPDSVNTVSAALKEAGAKRTIVTRVQ